MRGLSAAVTSSLVCALLWLPGASGQAGQWTTAQANPQRTGWQQQADGISPQSVKNLKLLWKLDTHSQHMALAGLVEPLIVSSGGRTLAVVAGASSDVYAIDANTGALVWQHHLKWSSSEAEQSPADAPRGFICENGLIDVPVIANGNVYVIGQDGYMHTLSLASGEEVGSPFMATPHPYPKVNALNLENNVIYSIQGQGCGGNPNTVYASDLATRKTSLLEPNQAGMWGNWGAAIGPNGNLYADTGDGAYNPKTNQLATSMLEVSPANKLVNYFTPSRYAWLTQRDLDMNFTPVIFPYNGADYAVASGKEGRYYLVNIQTMGGANHETPESETPLISNLNVNFQTEGSWGGASSWRDASGATWFLAPTGGFTNPAVHFPVTHGSAPNGGVIAMKLATVNGKAVLQPAWRSTDMITSQTPVIAGGVVFALGGGEFTGQANDNGSGLFSAMERVQLSVPAVLYALDAQTGAVLWHSGHEVTSFVHQGGVAVADGKVIFGTNDGTVYCYGLK